MQSIIVNFYVIIFSTFLCVVSFCDKIDVLIVFQWLVDWGNISSAG